MIVLATDFSLPGITRELSTTVSPVCGAVLDTAEDWQWWIECWQYVLDAADIQPQDCCLMAFSFGPFIGFWSAFEAAAARGCLVVPGGGMNTLARLELMRTSQIQRMLERMTKTGSVTSAVLREGYGKVDKAVDLFYLAMQISAPTGNPDLRGLINWTPDSAQAIALTRLRHDILRPTDANHPAYRSAHDILQAIDRLQRDPTDNHPMKTIPLDETITI